MSIAESLIFKTERPRENGMETIHVALIIDIIRHGETLYKEHVKLKNNGNKFTPLDVRDPGFKLDIEHLDLTEAGIAEIEQSANQLADIVDKNNEAIFILSSPTWRTQSSALILEKVFKDRDLGKNILNAENTPRFSKYINETISDLNGIWKKHGIDCNDSECSNEYGNALLELEETEKQNFQRLLRHINNIYKFLSPESIKKLNGKKLRIIIFAHEETTRDFIEQTMPAETHHTGQILEIVPENTMSKNREIKTMVKMYPKKEGPVIQNKAIREFKPETSASAETT